MGTLEKIKIFIFLVVIVFPLSIVAEKSEDNFRLQSIAKDINVIKSIVSDNAEMQNDLRGEITNLEYQVVAAQKIIKLIDRQVLISNEELLTLRDQMSTIEKEKDAAVMHYQSILLEEYKYRDYRTKLYFLASSKNIGQFINRLSHLKTLKEFRMKQLRALTNKEQETIDKLAVYGGTTDEKQEILNAKSDQIAQLNSLLRMRHQKYAELQEDNNDLSLSVKQKQEILNKLQNVAKNTMNKNETFEESLKLSWPVSSGIVVEQFGVHKHTKERRVKVTNNGIDILVNKDQPALSASVGKVKAVVSVPGMGNSVLVEHGKHFTVYSNLGEVFVKTDDWLEEGQALGKVNATQGAGYKLHFEVWKGTEKVDPELFFTNSLE